MKRLPPDERRKREEFARGLFARNPYMTIPEAQTITANEFGKPLSYTILSAIKSAYRLIKGITPESPPPPRWTPPALMAGHHTTLPFIDIERVKEQLRAMVIKGLSPQQRSPLSQIGRQLVSPDSPAYDVSFAREMENNAPPWFFVGKREVLLEMARRGDPRPSRTSPDKIIRALGQQLSSFTTKTSTSYDKVFDKQIRKMRPDWFKKIGGDHGN